MTSGADARPIVALTGASGFVGRRLAPLLHASGWRVRLLLRRDPVCPEWRGMDPQIVAGSLGDKDALLQLVTGVHAVVHVAGTIKAARRSDYYAVNHLGAEALAQAVVRAAPAARFLHLSTIGAREPQLSDYAGSKRAGEDAVLALLGDRVTVLRPPAVYGPGDRETLVFFQMASMRFVPLLAGANARAAMIHVEDLMALMVALLRDKPGGRVVTAADARPEGYSWREVFETAARAVGNAQANFFHAPAGLLRALALAGDLGKAFGAANMLNSQKLRELRHADWSVKPESWARPSGWEPRYSLTDGFAQTVAWYRRAGWL
jgi:2-alkyl-3-oxoalkanoate reductase